VIYAARVLVRAGLGLSLGAGLSAWSGHAEAAPGDLLWATEVGSAWARRAGVGPGVATSLDWGLSESTSATLRADAELYPQWANRAAYSYGSGAGLRVRWDVLRWVPWASGSVGPCKCALAANRAEFRTGLAWSLAAGGDFLWTREWRIPVGLRAGWSAGFADSARISLFPNSVQVWIGLGYLWWR
jgi:hypothetical protein